jgi:hypothetical protein
MKQCSLFDGLATVVARLIQDDVQFFCFWVGYPKFFKEMFDTVSIHRFDKLTGARHGFQFDGTDDVDASFGRGGGDGLF